MEQIIISKFVEILRVHGSLCIDASQNEQNLIRNRIVLLATVQVCKSVGHDVILDLIGV